MLFNEPSTPVLFTRCLFTSGEGGILLNTSWNIWLFTSSVSPSLLGVFERQQSLLFIFFYNWGDCFPCFHLIVIVCNSSHGKVMFSHVSVCLQRGEVYTPCQVDTPCQIPSRDGYCSGRYASYWNAFLFKIL